MGCQKLSILNTEYQPLKVAYGRQLREQKCVQWFLSVDPIAVYDPVLQTEFYGFNQHNGGETNEKNLNVYGYCYQNPIIWLDPNGKQNLTRIISYNKNGNITSIVDNYSNLDSQDYPEYSINNPGIKYIHKYAPSSGYPYGRTETQMLMNGKMPTDYGFYSGSGSVTLFGDDSAYDFSIQPIDIADAIAKVHDLEYLVNQYDENIGVVNDTNTLQADIDMVKRVKLALSGVNSQDEKMKLGYLGGEGIEKPRWEGLYTVTLIALKGQLEVISLMRDFKQWKLDNGYNREDSILDKEIYNDYKEYAGWLKANATMKIGKESAKKN